MGGALALDAAWLFAAFLITLILVAVGIAVRRFLLERGGAGRTRPCRPNGSWRLGVASYQREELCWFGALGVSMRPDVVFPRRDLTVVSRRLPSDAEAASLGPGMIVVECQLGEDGESSGPALAGPPGQRRTVELAMGEAALTGLLAWLEAAPPGSHLGVAL